MELLSLSWTYTLHLFAFVLNYYISSLTLIKFLYSHFPFTKGMRFINKKLYRAYSLLKLEGGLYLVYKLQLDIIFTELPLTFVADF